MPKTTTKRAKPKTRKKKITAGAIKKPDPQVKERAIKKEKERVKKDKIKDEVKDKAKKKKNPFYGITKKEKARAKGMNTQQYDANAVVWKFRKHHMNDTFKQKATGKSDPEVRSKLMKESWAVANEEARKKYWNFMKKNNLDPWFGKPAPSKHPSYSNSAS
jgi:hypothetical protein